MVALPALGYLVGLHSLDEASFDGLKHLLHFFFDFPHLWALWSSGCMC